MAEQDPNRRDERDPYESPGSLRFDASEFQRVAELWNRGIRRNIAWIPLIAAVLFALIGIAADEPITRAGGLVASGLALIAMAIFWQGHEAADE